MDNYKKLDVWKKAMRFTSMVYDVVESLPQKHAFTLGQQLERSAISVPSNVAEGSARKTSNEFVYHLYVARGSLAEADTQLLIALERKLINKTTYDDISLLANDVGRMLTRLIQSLLKTTRDKP